MEATAVVTRLGSLSIPRSTNSTAPAKAFGQVMPNRHRNRRLADAAGADDGDKARSGQLSRQLENVVIPADHPAQAAGKIGVRKIGGGGGRIFARSARREIGATKQ